MVARSFQLPVLAKCLVALCFFIFASLVAVAQVEPDTVKRKPSLPTGPPGQQPVYTPPKPQPKPQPTIQEHPQEPVAIKEEEEIPELIDRLYFGGSFGLQFGSYTNISLLPIIGYRVTPKFNVGTGVVYHFIKDGEYSLHNYGGRLFTQVEVVQIGEGALLAHAEAEFMSRQYLMVNATQTAYEKHRKTLVLPMVGVGYRQFISEKASFDLLLLYNVNEDEVNPYSNPVIRAGINLPFRR